MAVIIVIYVLIILAIGIYCSRYVKSMEDFALAGRSLSMPVLVGTLLASLTGGATLIGWTGSVYANGIDWLWGELGVLLGLIAAGFLLAERTRRLEQYTIPDLLRIRYNGRTATLGSIMIIIGDIALTCVQIMSIGGILSSFLGWSSQLSMVVGTVIFIAIAFYGGMVGVAITDAIQAIFIIGGLIVVTASVINFAGGWNEMLAKIPSDYFTFTSHLKISDGIALALATAGTIAVWQSIIFSRLFAAKSPQVAKKSMIVMLPIQVLVISTIFLLATAALAIFGPGLKPAEVFGTLLTKAANPIMGAILLAVVIGALLTTTNTILLSISVNITRDFYQRFISKNTEEVNNKPLLKVGRFTVLIIGVLALVMAMLMPNIITALVFTYTMYSAALLIPVYGGFLWKRATAAGGFWGILFGGGVALIWHLAGSPFALNPMIPAAIASAMAFIIGSYATSPPSKEQLKVFDV